MMCFAPCLPARLPGLQDMVRSTTGPTDFARGFGQGPLIIQLP